MPLAASETPATASKAILIAETPTSATTASSRAGQWAREVWGGVEGFRGSGVMAGLVQAVDAVEEDEMEEQAIEGAAACGPSERSQAAPEACRGGEARAVGRTSGTAERAQECAGYYIGVYAAVALAGLVVTTLRWSSLYGGSIHASRVLYKRLLESVLFANIRFHDTVSRGRVLNRFGTDFEGTDSSLQDNSERTAMYSLSTATTIITVSVVAGKVYGQTFRDMRRLDSVMLPAVVTILRAFGASTKFMRDMLRCVDTNANPY
ncbi:uncharacterized protein SCHCODRAFT_01176824 [Schizophyllum commune H4-8]|nr:uncharacterized protein SCHCODRAFT_01176824 [Schizophyllum commune H4-8]KAI5885446.1 hypothetical protein SCHCODRAFT_01176824 [Schizophyllum commune H4-8]